MTFASKAAAGPVLYCPWLLSGNEWLADQLLTLDADGRISACHTGQASDADERLPGVVIPGMPNLHSHAFQYLMAGLSARRGSANDSFWTWRETMYAMVGRLDPDRLEAVASACYAEMLRQGYTSVAEFHYLHHDPQGRPYQDLAENARRIHAAAVTTGIGLCLLPVFYARSGFGARDVNPAQRPFAHDRDSYQQLLQQIDALPGSALFNWGLAPHSLRAASADELQWLSQLLEQRTTLNHGPDVLHIHIAEQQQEVRDCQEFYGQRPLQWLLSNLPVDRRWCLVHATHADDSELQSLLDSNAVAGLCPTTEADLGDGLFPAQALMRADGRFGVGSDSNLLLDPAEELRLLEFGQRLASQRRNLLHFGSEHLGTGLWAAAVAGGQQALGRCTDAAGSGLRPGQLADLLVLNHDHVLLAGLPPERQLDSFIFARQAGMLSQVRVAGRLLVEQGQHLTLQAREADLARTLSRLRAG